MLAKTVALPPGRGMNGCGPTALVRPGRGHRRPKRLSERERASGGLDPLPSVHFSSDRGKASAGGGSSRSLWK